MYQYIINLNAQNLLLLYIYTLSATVYFFPGRSNSYCNITVIYITMTYILFHIYIFLQVLNSLASFYCLQEQVVEFGHLQNGRKVDRQKISRTIQRHKVK